MKLIKLFQPNCTPCEYVENYLQNKDVVYESINLQENPDVAGKYGIMSAPVTILLDDNGDEVGRSIGFKPAEIDKLISQL